MGFNGFDYTKRASSGLDLAQSVYDDILAMSDRLPGKLARAAKIRKQQKKLNQNKERLVVIDETTTSAKTVAFKIGEKTSTPVKKESQKASQKFRRVKNDLRLRIPGKALGDAGLERIAEALEIAQNECPYLAVTEIIIPNNGLTAWSLGRLARAISMARGTLRVVDVSRNAVALFPGYWMDEYEIFVYALSQCRQLRVLDLSDNIGLGHKGLEVFARVYAGQRFMHPFTIRSITIGDLKFTELDVFICLFYRQARHKISESTLRTVPYINIRNTGLNNIAVLFLATLMKDHPFPAQLIGSSDLQVLYKSDQVTGSVSGIDWSDNNKTLSRECYALLEAACRIRSMNVDTDNTALAKASPAEEEDVSQSNAVDFTWIAEVTQRFIRQSLSAVWSARSEDQIAPEQSKTQLAFDHQVAFDKARKMMERTILVQVGPNYVQLWQTAFRVLLYARKLCVFDVRRSSKILSDDQRVASRHITTARDERVTRSTNLIDARLATIKQVSQRTIFDSLPLIGRYSDNVLKAIVSRREKWLAVMRQTRIKTPDIPLVILDNRWLVWQRKKMSKTNAGTSAPDAKPAEAADRSSVCRLPLPICVKILSQALPSRNFRLPKPSRVLSPRQFGKIIEWGRSRSSLAIEMSWSDEDNASQQWKLLDAIGCLSY